MYSHERYWEGVFSVWQAAPPEQLVNHHSPTLRSYVSLTVLYVIQLLVRYPANCSPVAHINKRKPTFAQPEASPQHPPIFCYSHRIKFQSSKIKNCTHFLTFFFDERMISGQNPKIYSIEWRWFHESLIPVLQKLTSVWLAFSLKQWYSLHVHCDWKVIDQRFYCRPIVILYAVFTIVELKSEMC